MPTEAKITKCDNCGSTPAGCTPYGILCEDCEGDAEAEADRVYDNCHDRSETGGF